MADGMILYGSSSSGNCHKVEFVARRLGIPYRWQETSIPKGETRTPEFLALNPEGRIPTVILPDRRVLWESNAIMLYLADGTDLIPADRYERAQMFQWLFWEQYSHEPAIAVRRARLTYQKQPESELDPTLKPRCERVLGIMESHLASRRYFVGERLSLADIALVAYTRFAHEAGFDLTNWPSVERWVNTVTTDLGVA